MKHNNCFHAQSMMNKSCYRSTANNLYSLNNKRHFGGFAHNSTLKISTQWKKNVKQNDINDDEYKFGFSNIQILTIPVKRVHDV